MAAALAAGITLGRYGQFCTGFWAVLAGAFVGGVTILRIGIYRALWIFGILQGVSTLGFAVLAGVGASLSWLAGVIAFENESQGKNTEEETA